METNSHAAYASATSIMERDRRTWAMLLLGPFGAAVALAGAFPDELLLEETPLLLTFFGSILPAAWAAHRGPRPGVEILVAALVGFAWYPLGWVAAWARFGEGAGLVEWFDAVRADLVFIETRTVAGIETERTETQGVPFAHFVEVAWQGAVLLGGMVALPRLIARCPACGRAASPRFVGLLSFEAGSSPALSAEDALRAHLGAPTPLAPITTQVPTAVRVRLTTCTACGSASARGFLTVNGSSAGYTRDLALTPGESATLAAG